MRSADLSGYSVGSHLFIFRFDTFTGCGPLTLGWYSVGSHLFLGAVLRDIRGDSSHQHNEAGR
jgi:hypothetical protein